MTKLKSLFLAILLSSSIAVAGQPGDDAPGFELPDQTGKIHTLEDYAGKWVVLYFYPKDNTPGCTTQSCEFRDNIFAFKRENAQIIGVSFDDVDSKKAFAEEYNLPFPLLADTEGKLIDAYNVRGSFMGMKIAKRETFLISPEGKIAKHYEKVDPETHSEEVLADLAELNKAS